ncbi:MAG: chain length determinant protein tyrosine kinase EpsG [Pseudomonadota bacterium]
MKPHDIPIQPQSTERSLGAILVDSGKLTLDDAERILRAQKAHGLRFGEAAIQLGLVTRTDMELALASQYDYPYLLQTEDGEVATELIAAYEPFSPQVEALRALRSQLMLRWFTGEEERRTLAIASPARGDGRSYLAANLAVVFSQLGEHTLLIDADMRNPRQHELFKLDNQRGLSSLLSGRGELSVIERIPSFVDLSVLPAGPIPPNPQELLGRPTFARLLDEMVHEYDVVIIDTPAAADYADVQTIAVRASGALLLARSTRTRVSEFRELSKTLAQSGVAMVGSVLNDPLPVKNLNRKP